MNSTAVAPLLLHFRYCHGCHGASLLLWVLNLLCPVLTNPRETLPNCPGAEGFEMSIAKNKTNSVALSPQANYTD
jgi:hypothetical protein